MTRSVLMPLPQSAYLVRRSPATLRRWAKQGHITLHPGGYVDHLEVEAALVAMRDAQHTGRPPKENP